MPKVLETIINRYAKVTILLSSQENVNRFMNVFININLYIHTHRTCTFERNGDDLRRFLMG